MKIAVDFDGTCVKHEFPRVGADIGAVPVLKRLVEEGHKLILFTMRSDIKKVEDDQIIEGYETQSGNFLTEAVNWFEENGIPLHGVNEDPGQKNWTASPKAYAQLYIDDAALGIPLRVDGMERPYVDWYSVTMMLEEKGILTRQS